MYRQSSAHSTTQATPAARFQHERSLYNLPDNLYDFFLDSAPAEVKESQHEQTMVGPMAEFGRKADDVPLHLAGGGAAVCFWQ
jgi:hypothetical protein